MAIEIKKESVITEQMSFVDSIKAVLTQAETPINEPFEGLRFTPFFVRCGRTNYDDLLNLYKNGMEFQIQKTREDNTFSKSKEYKQLVEGLNEMRTFIDGVEFGQMLIAKQIIDSVK